MRKKSPVLKRIYVILLFSFLYLPIAVMIIFSFNESKSRSIFTGFTLDWYKMLFRDKAVLSALAFSVLLAILAAAIATVLGTMASVVIAKMSQKWQSIVLGFTYVPIINPEILTGVSLMLLFVVAKSGLNAMGGNFAWISEKLIGFPSLLIAHITFSLPYVVFNVVPKLKQLDSMQYEAALDLGCNERQAFFKVILPEIMPAVFTSFLICITYSIDDFTISYFTSGNKQTLPIAIYSMTRRKVSPEINALSTIIFAVILFVIFVANIKDDTKEKRIPR